jgi:threonine dehydratase
VGEVIAATRGNHGQSVAFAARSLGITPMIFVPKGNSPEKDRAMRAFGADLKVHGEDFTETYAFARGLAEERGLHIVPSFHPLLVKGVASYSLEFLRAAPDLDTVYVPIGLGSGICGMIAARGALNLKTRIVGVVAERAPTYALSFQAKKPVPTNSSDTIADGVAVREPDQEALDVILKEVERIVAVSEEEILAAIRHYFTDTHNLAEGAGAMGLASLLKERGLHHGKKVGVVLTGGNIDRELYLEALRKEGLE